MQLAELYEYRELLAFLIWRDVKIRYKQTAIGAVWAILQPLLHALVFTLLFHRVAGISSGGVDYTLFSYAGLVVWTFHAQGLALGSNSLVASANVITKVYFPRILLPLSSVLAGLLDLAIAASLVGVLMASNGVPLTWRVTTVPVILALAVAVTIGSVLWLSALNVMYRDVRFVVPFLVQIWLFVSPVIYPMEVLEPHLGRVGAPTWIFGLNPMVGVVEGFRWAVLGSDLDIVAYLVPGALAASVLLVTGVAFFHRVQRIVADVA